MHILEHIFNITHYYLNPYSIAPLLVATLVLIFGFFLYFLDKKSYFNQTLLYFSLASGMWLYSCVLILNSRLPDVAAFWGYFLYIGFIAVPATVFHLSASLTEKYPEQKKVVGFSYFVVLLLIPLCQNPYFFFDVKKEGFGFYPMAGFLQPVLLFFFAACFLGSFINLIRYHFSLSDNEERQRTKLFIFSFVILIFSAMDLGTTYEYYLYPSGFIAFLGFIIGITCFKFMFYAAKVERHAQELEDEVELKTRELSNVVEELRATQLQLLETGKKSALASLSAGILHQISQPITVIHGFVRFIKKEMKEDNTFYKPISHIEEQSVYIKQMLEDLMNLVRHREIKKENLDVNVVIKRAMNLLTDELRIRRVNWDMSLAEEMPLLYADSVHLQQIFMNFVINALQAFEALPRGSQRYIKITSKFDNRSKEIFITFADTSAALSEEEKKIIEEPFFAIQSRASAIGLALCQDLITEHGGLLAVESGGEVKGRAFVLKFPIAEVDDKL